MEENFPTFNQIKQHHEIQKAQILNSFKNAGDEVKTSKLLTKADFESSYPLDKFEVYSLGKIQEFREEFMKGEGYTDEKFKEATKGLESFVVTNEGNKAIVFVRKKVAGV